MKSKKSAADFRISSESIEKYGLEFFNSILKNSLWLNKKFFNEITVEEELVENPGNPGKKLTISFIAWPTDSMESELVVKSQFKATMENHIYAVASGEWKNY